MKAHFEVNQRDLGKEFIVLVQISHVNIPFFFSVSCKVQMLRSDTFIWTDLLKHDKVLSKKPIPTHLRDVPDYLLDPTTQEASKIVKLARAAMGNTNPARRQGSRRKFRKSRDPLKTFSAEVFWWHVTILIYFLTLCQLMVTEETLDKWRSASWY